MKSLTKKILSERSLLNKSNVGSRYDQCDEIITRHLIHQLLTSSSIYNMNELIKNNDNKSSGSSPTTNTKYKRVALIDDIASNIILHSSYTHVRYILKSSGF